MARGRMATQPTQMTGAGWLDIAARVKGRIGADKLTLIAAGVAFFGLLALFPAITAVLAIGGLVLEPQTIVSELERLAGVVPSDVIEIIRTQAMSVTASGGLGLTLLVSTVLALWSTSRGVNTLVDGLNVAYEESESRGFFTRNLHVLGLTVAIVTGLVLALVLLVGVPAVLSLVTLGAATEGLARVASWILLCLFSIAALALMYRHGPSRETARWSWVIPGAVFACIGWIVASYGFSIYVSNFASYNESFGALGSVIVLLLWLWITVLVILIGAEINAEMEHQTRMDTTTGQPERRGDRGAVMADNVGEARNV